MNNLLLVDDEKTTAFTIGNLDIKWYGIIITAAILIATIYCVFEFKRHKASVDYVLTLFLWVIPLAVIFARLAYVIFNPSEFFPFVSGGRETWWEGFLNMWNIRGGGISILGAIPGGALGAFLNHITNKEKVNFMEVLDCLAPAMILGQALGRWGNFVNQELYGKIVTNPDWQFFPFAVFIDDLDGWYQATFFYEMVLNLIGFAILVVIGRKVKKNLASLTFYLTYYLAVRSFMESLRSDAVAANGIRVGVVGCAIGAVLAFTVFMLICFDVIKTGVPKYAIEAIDESPTEQTDQSEENNE